MNIKKINFKERKNVVILVGVVIVLIIIGVFLSRGLRGHSLKIWNDNNVGESVDIANSEDYSKFEGKVETFFEGPQNLEFSFLHNNINKVVQGKGDQSKWFKIFDKDNKNNVTLYFTYEGGRGWSVNDYIQEVVDKNKLGELKIQDVKFVDAATSSIKFIVDEKGNTSYYLVDVKGINGEPWLAIVENLNAKDEVSQNIAKDLIRSLEIK